MHKLITTLCLITVILTAVNTLPLNVSAAESNPSSLSESIDENKNNDDIPFGIFVVLAIISSALTYASNKRKNNAQDNSDTAYHNDNDESDILPHL